ncbi:MAG: sporulation protein YtxC [Bacillota bacterium]
MAVVSVGSSNYRDCLQQRFAVEAEILKQDNIIIEVNPIKQGDKIFFECSTANGAVIFQVLKEFIANVLSDIIINYLEIDLLYKLVNVNCKDFNQVEKEDIINLVLDRLNIAEKGEHQISTKIKRKNKILLEIIDYIEDNKEIILEGFVRFRLKKYLTKLEVTVKKALEEYKVEKEYKGVIHLLKYYLDAQQETNKLVHVIKINEHRFELLDQQKNIIENPFFNKSIFKELEQRLEYEGLLMRALITIAPQEIIIHFKEPVELVKKLEEVFAKQISICLGCSYCKIENYKTLEEKSKEEKSKNES